MMKIDHFCELKNNLETEKEDEYIKEKLKNNEKENGKLKNKNRQLKSLLENVVNKISL